MSLPEGVAPYKTTPRFTTETVPKGLLKDHSLKAGTWGLIQVHAGELRYFLAGETQPLATLQTEQSWAVPPQVLHFVELSDDGVFSVVFHR